MEILASGWLLPAFLLFIPIVAGVLSLATKGTSAMGQRARRSNTDSAVKEFADSMVKAPVYKSTSR